MCTNELKSTKGITLISLVITIVVLLILAGISINTLIGDNGIFKQAAKAKEVTEKASIDEQKQLTMLNAIMQTENYIENLGKNLGTGTELEKRKEKNGDGDGVEKSGKSVPVPKFHPF